MKKENKNLQNKTVITETWGYLIIIFFGKYLV